MRKSFSSPSSHFLSFSFLFFHNFTSLSLSSVFLKMCVFRKFPDFPFFFSLVLLPNERLFITLTSLSFSSLHYRYWENVCKPLKSSKNIGMYLWKFIPSTMKRKDFFLCFTLLFLVYRLYF